MSTDDSDAERHELLRLLSTAQDDERKSIIRNSLMMLDSPDHRNDKRGKKPLKTPFNAHLFDGERIGLEASYTKSPPIRPMSARLRRPSMNNLDVIQEEFRGSFRKKEIKLSDSAEKREITTIVIEDILELSASSYDPRFSPWNLFSFVGSNSNLHNSSFWVSTGLMPQYIAFELKMNWDIREVRVICSNVEQVSFTVEGAVSKVSMHKINSTCFSYDLKSVPETSQVLRAFGDKIVFHFEAASDMFIIVKNIQIRAIPSES